MADVYYMYVAKGINVDTNEWVTYRKLVKVIPVWIGGNVYFRRVKK